jgi:non-specific serine/threonine protein kinase
LFVERAKLVRPDFDLTVENASSVASICARLDGIPLAIEMAAPRLRSMSVDELSQRLGQRFALLTDGSRAALPRHRTLRSMLDWSYDLSTEREQAMLRRVAVFSGGWTLASAEQVCAGDGIDASNVCEQLTSLVDKSLVATDEHAGATRYRVLETIRQYALDRLRESGEEAPWRVSHLACFVSLAEAFKWEQFGPQQQSWFSRIESEHGNLRAALAWSAESSPVEGVRLAAALDLFWRLRGHVAEGRQWLARLLDAFPIDGPMIECGRGLLVAGLLAQTQGDYAAAKRLLQESLALFRKLDYALGLLYVLTNLAGLSTDQGHYPEAEVLWRESLDRARAMGERKALFSSLGGLAVVLHRQGQWAAACELYGQALAMARDDAAPWFIGSTLNDMARAECDEGRHDLALKHLTEGVALLHGLGDRPGVIESLEGFAGVAAATAAPRRAARLWGAADALRQEMGNAKLAHLSIAYERQVKAVHAMLTTEAFDQAWDEGRAMAFDDAVRYALDEQAGCDT